MKRFLLATLWAVPAALAAQHPDLKVMAGYALGQYREESKVLDFRGQGPALRVDATWRRWGLLVEGRRLDLKPTTPDNGFVPFTTTETEIALRFQPRRALPAEVEIGTIRRTASPATAAQELRAFRAGGAAHFALGDGAIVDTRAAWLFGAKFSGGGKATTAMTLGLRAAYRPLRRYGWGWLVVDYAFERYDRTTDAPVPLQGSTVAMGVEARFRP